MAILVPQKTDYTTNLTANEFNGSVVELLRTFNFSQVVPNGLFENGSNNQFDQLLKYYTQACTFFAATGVSNNIVLSTPSPKNTQKAYYNGMRVWFIAPFTNTGAVTINIDTIGVINVINEGGGVLITGDITLNEITELFYNGTNFILKRIPKPTAIVKFSVNDASLNSITGKPNYITAPAAKTLQIDGSVTPIKGTYYDGSTFTINNLNSYNTNGFANDTYCAIYEDGMGIIHNLPISKITESHLLPSGGVDGDYWIFPNPLKTYKKISGVWQATKWCMLGEYPTLSSGTIGTIENYALNGFYNSGNVSVSPNTTLTFNHSIGVKPSFLTVTGVTLNATAKIENSYLEWDGNSGSGSFWQGPTSSFSLIGTESTRNNLYLRGRDRAILNITGSGFYNITIRRSYGSL